MPCTVMASPRPPNFDSVARALRRLGTTAGVPEAHGSLCGLACLLGSQAPAAWVRDLESDAAQTEARDDDLAGVLSELATSTCTALAAGDMTFSPLLPPDDRPLTFRAGGLAEWCAGFMHGLGEAAGGRAPPGVLEAGITREVMQDFSEIARAALGDEETEIEAEAAYAELVEFVRVSVQLVFEDLHRARRDLSDQGVH